MPEFADIPFDVLSLNLSLEADFGRTPGLHLTDITKDMLLLAGINRGGGKAFSEQQQKMLFESGFLWERIIEFILQSQARQRDIEASNGILIRPGEFTSDGIIATPDAINMAGLNLEEWKATSVRSNKFDIQTHRPEWLWQAGFYARFFGMDTVVFRRWHYCEMPQVVKQTMVKFTQKELDDNHSRIIKHAKWRGWL